MKWLSGSLHLSCCTWHRVAGTDSCHVCLYAEQDGRRQSPPPKMCYHNAQGQSWLGTALQQMYRVAVGDLTLRVLDCVGTILFGVYLVMWLFELVL